MAEKESYPSKERTSLTEEHELASSTESDIERAPDLASNSGLVQRPSPEVERSSEGGAVQDTVSTTSLYATSTATEDSSTTHSLPKTASTESSLSKDSSATRSPPEIESLLTEDFSASRSLPELATRSFIRGDSSGTLPIYLSPPESATKLSMSDDSLTNRSPPETVTGISSAEDCSAIQTFPLKEDPTDMETSEVSTKSTPDLVCDSGLVQRSPPEVEGCSEEDARVLLDRNMAIKKTLASGVVLTLRRCLLDAGILTVYNERLGRSGFEAYHAKEVTASSSLLFEPREFETDGITADGEEYILGGVKYPIPLSYVVPLSPTKHTTKERGNKECSKESEGQAKKLKRFHQTSATTNLNQDTSGAVKESSTTEDYFATRSTPNKAIPQTEDTSTILSPPESSEIETSDATLLINRSPLATEVTGSSFEENSIICLPPERAATKCSIPKDSFATWSPSESFKTEDFSASESGKVAEVVSESGPVAEVVRNE